MGVRSFNTLFAEEPQKPEEKKLQRGRDADLAARSIEELLHRYLYYGLYTDKRYDVIIHQLTVERHITARRISDIIQENMETLAALRKNPPSLKELREKYPHLVWA